MSKELKVDPEAVSAYVLQFRDIGYALNSLKTVIMKEGTASILDQFQQLEAVYNKDYHSHKKMSFLDKIAILGFCFIAFAPWVYGIYKFFN